MNKFIEEHGLIVIMRGIEIDVIPDLVKALYDGGARIVETTFNPSDPDTVKKTGDMIRKIYETMGEKIVVGAGTVLCKEHVIAAKNAGAKFIYSPNTDTEVIKLTKELGMMSIPGAFTPTEIMTAYNAGADLIKLFPITKNDIDYVTGITRPLSHIPFICTGGVNPDTIELFIKAGAKAVGTGISILKSDLIENRNFAEISSLTKLHLEKIQDARK